MRSLSSRYWRNSVGFIFKLSADRLASELNQSSDCQLREASFAEAVEIGAWSSTDINVIKRRLDAHDRCLALLHKGCSVAALWLHHGECYVRGVDLWIRESPRTYYCYGVITKPSERRRGYYRRLVNALERLVVEEGGGAVIQYVELENAIPQSVLSACGYTHLEVASRRRGCIRNIAVYDPTTTKCTNNWRIGEPSGKYRI